MKSERKKGQAEEDGLIATEEDGDKAKINMCVGLKTGGMKTGRQTDRQTDCISLQWHLGFTLSHVIGNDSRSLYTTTTRD